MDNAIQFHNYNTLDFRLSAPKATIALLNFLIKNEGFEIMSLQYIFCSDDELLEINRTHLNHDFYTDVIGFDQSDENNTIEGDIFVSIDRITENAKDFGVSFEEELHRVMTHGLLHFVGYKDKSESEQKEMRAKESFYLNEWKA